MGRRLAELGKIVGPGIEIEEPEGVVRALSHSEGLQYVIEHMRRQEEWIEHLHNLLGIEVAKRVELGDEVEQLRRHNAALVQAAQFGGVIQAEEEDTLADPSTWGEWAQDQPMVSVEHLSHSLMTNDAIKGALVELLDQPLIVLAGSTEWVNIHNDIRFRVWWADGRALTLRDVHDTLWRAVGSN